MSEARFGWLARTFPIAGTAAALSLCLWTDLAGAQEESDEVPETATASVDPGAVQEVEVTFSFKDQTWDEILDFFSRTTGASSINRAPSSMAIT